MTDNEIIEALECCIDMECSKCPLNYDDCEERDFESIVKRAIPIFNRQKAENERLQEFYDDMQTSIYEFREDHAKVKFFKNEIKSEAIKEFAERLCDGRISNDPIVIAVKTELKIMKGELNDGR